MASLIGMSGRFLGIVSAALTALIWIYIIWFPAETLGITGVTMLVAAFMVLLALVAGIASFNGHAVVVFIACLASFVPIGAILLGVDHWLRFIGVLNVLLALSGVMIWFGHRTSKAQT